MLPPVSTEAGPLSETSSGIRRSSRGLSTSRLKESATKWRFASLLSLSVTIADESSRRPTASTEMKGRDSPFWIEMPSPRRETSLPLQATDSKLSETRGNRSLSNSPGSRVLDTVTSSTPVRSFPKAGTELLLATDPECSLPPSTRNRSYWFRIASLTSRSSIKRPKSANRSTRRCRLRKSSALLTSL